MTKLKCFIILVCLLFCCPAYGDWFFGGSACPDCSGTLYMKWDCDNVDITTDGGCSDDDTSAALGDDAAIASDWLVLNDTGNDGLDRATFAISAADIEDVFTVFVKFKVTTWVDNEGLFILYGDANDYIVVKTYSSNDLQAVFIQDGTSDTVTLTGNHIATGTEYIFRYRAKVGEAGTDHELTLYDASMVEIETDADDDDLVALTNTPVSLYLGDYYIGGTGYNTSIDFCRVFKEWRDDNPCPDID